MFIIRGLYKNKEYTIEWNDGKIYAEDEILKKVYEENKKEHGFLGEAPAIMLKDYIKYQFSARSLIIKYVFDEVLEEKNDISPRRSDAIY